MKMKNANKDKNEIKQNKNTSKINIWIRTKLQIK